MAVSDRLLDNNYRVYWMGHTGEMSAKYSSNKAVLPIDLIESMRAAYQRSRRYLLGDTLDEESIRRKQMLDTARMLGYGEEKMAKLTEILERTRTVEEAVVEFQKLNEQPLKEPAKPSNGRYEIVEGEAVMLGCLSEGWTLERELNDDRFLMKKT